MIKEKKRKLHTITGDNGGFSLLELIVSVTILAVILIPLLSAFFVSARSVTKSKQTADQNAVAQSLYEKVQAKKADFFFHPLRGDNKSAVLVSGSENNPQVNKGEYNSVLSYLGGEGYVSDVSSEGWDTKTSQLGSIGWDTTNDETSHHGDSVRIGLQHLFRNANGVEYAATVSLQSGVQDIDVNNLITDQDQIAQIKKEHNGDIDDLVSGDAIKDINEKKLTSPMSFTHFWVQQTGMASNPDQKIEDMIGEDGVRTIVTKRQRTIMINLKKEVDTEDGTTTTYIVPQIRYAYDITFNRQKTDGTGFETIEIAPDDTLTKAAPGKDDNGRITPVFEEDGDRFIYSQKKADGSEEVKTFDYFFSFSPYYNASSSKKDNIIIVNKEGFKGDFYLLKQTKSEYDSKRYDATVRLLENHDNDRNNYNITVHTNMGLRSDSTPTHERRVAGTIELRKFYKMPEIAALRHSSADKYYVDGTNDETFMRLINQSARERAYSVKICIYKQKDYEKGVSAEIKDGKIVYNNKVDPVYTLEGFKLD